MGEGRSAAARSCDEEEWEHPQHSGLPREREEDEMVEVGVEQSLFVRPGWVRARQARGWRR